MSRHAKEYWNIHAEADDRVVWGIGHREPTIRLRTIEGEGVLTIQYNYSEDETADEIEVPLREQGTVLIKPGFYAVARAVEGSAWTATAWAPAAEVQAYDAENS
jgi:hypothetical protein